MTEDSLDPRTPVIVGVGQFSERIDAETYEGLSPTAIAARAAQEAINDVGVDSLLVATSVDIVAATRPFDASVPGAAAPFGRSANFPRSVAQRVGATPRRAVFEVAGGQSPQHLVNEFAAEIARGGADCVLLVGAEVTSTVRHLAGSEPAPDFSDKPEGSLEDRGLGLKGLISRQQVLHGLTDAPTQYALLENARRARLGLDRSSYAAAMGALFAPFTEVAAQNPHAASREVRTAAELIDIHPGNRMIADPYPRLVVARDQVNLAASVLMMSVATARRLGVASERWVFLQGRADLTERPVFERPDLGSSPAAVAAVEAALEDAGVSLADIAWLDLYSCFPIAVFNLCDGLGLAADDPRRLTVTGGLPYFGGPGNNYSMHAIAEVIDLVRSHPGTLGLVAANGGVLSKHSTGVYGTRPVGLSPDRSPQVQKTLENAPGVVEAVEADGWAQVETFTVKHGRESRTAVVVGRLESDGRRFVAQAADDESMVTALDAAERPADLRVYVRSFGYGNRVTRSEEEMDRLLPRVVPQLRETYDFVTVRREGHLLEVTLNRPEVRNSLHPPAHEELEEIFDAYFDDPDLWVAIITGAGDTSFSAGNDLLYGFTGKPMYFPKSGFAGLTHRSSMPKPVIAAVNGFAMGGGFETALACHLVVAAENAQFALSEVKVGLVAAAGGLVRLPRSVPEKVAHELILTGRRISAEEAAGWGVVNRVVPEGQALDEARRLATEILAGSPTSARISLQLMAEAQDFPNPVVAVRNPTPLLDELVFSEDSLEGMMAFAEKRTPVWKNR